MIEFEETKKVSTRLNIAPLVDVVFLLLIFFMLSSHFITQPGIKLSLPAAATGKLHEEGDIIIFIAEDNSLYLNQDKVTLEEFENRLRTRMEERGSKTVIVKADEKIELKLAVQVIDTARKAGAEAVIISTKIGEDVE